ncbi:hypothetical protein MMC2321_02772 [Chitinophaga sp. MM2321]
MTTSLKENIDGTTTQQVVTDILSIYNKER